MQRLNLPSSRSAIRPLRSPEPILPAFTSIATSSSRIKSIDLPGGVPVVPVFVSAAHAPSTGERVGQGEQLPFERRLFLEVCRESTL